MAEYIDKRAAIADLNETYDKMSGFHAQFYNGYQVAVNRLRVFPAAEVEPVRHGEWTKSEDDWNSLTTITCSECHEEWCFETEEDVNLLNYRYCPNCGARMDGGADNG